jgi:hypothetical protein
VGAGPQTGRWVKDAAGDISRSTPLTPVPGGSVVLYGPLAGAAAPTLALRGPAAAAEGAGSPNAPTQRALGRENWALGAQLGAGSTLRRSRRPPLLPPSFLSPSLLLSLPPPPPPRPLRGRKKKFGGRWVADWVLGAYPGGHPTGAGWVPGRPSGRREALGERWVCAGYRCRA